MDSCAGIDFGSKKAGTTVISYIDPKGHFTLKQSQKNQDADEFLLNEVKKVNPQILTIDAPLSIPPGILGKGNQFFYRQCDRMLKAMSPMFLGGLTARAMAIKKSLQEFCPQIKVFETYPKAFVQHIGSDQLKKVYKSDLILFYEELKKIQPAIDVPVLMNWHQADSVLAFISAIRIQNGQVKTFGVEEEGLIYI